MHIPVTIAEFWKRFDADAGGIDPTRFYEAFHFGDSEEMATQLAELVLAGTKRATAGSIWSFENEGKALPQAGALSVVTNWAGAALCVIETVRVDIVAFKEVTAEFAAAEGEGDGSLAF
ncbi:MAG: ASCH domain-containing protein [Burkholderiaceae bacterium]